MRWGLPRGGVPNGWGTAESASRLPQVPTVSKLSNSEAYLLGRKLHADSAMYYEEPRDTVAKRVVLADNSLMLGQVWPGSGPVDCAAKVATGLL